MRQTESCQSPLQTRESNAFFCHTLCPAPRCLEPGLKTNMMCWKEKKEHVKHSSTEWITMSRRCLFASYVYLLM